MSPFWSQDANLTWHCFSRDFARSARSAQRSRFACSPTRSKTRMVISSHFASCICHPGLECARYPGHSAAGQSEGPSRRVGGMEGFTGTRTLHAKVVLVEGTRSGLAYLGSGNFTGRGWGFLPDGTDANTEAGLILRRSAKVPILFHCCRTWSASPSLLSAANLHSLQAPEQVPSDEPWPEFIKQVLLLPVSSGDETLQLRIDTVPETGSFLWHARLLDKDGVLGESLVSVERTQGCGSTSLTVPLSPEILSRLLTDQEILIAWNDCHGGRPFPLNVEASARLSLQLPPATKPSKKVISSAIIRGR
jgi:hypothetical protein